MKLFSMSVRCALLCFISSHSFAQQGAEASFARYLGTINVLTTPAYADGQLIGCLFEFNSLSRDWTYKQGAFLQVNGSFGFYRTNNDLGVTLKVVVNEFDTVAGKFIPTSPSSAYFIDGHNTTKSSLLMKAASDTPGGLFSVFALNPSSAIVTDGMLAGKVTIGFARKDGGVDIVLPIDVLVKDTTSSGERIRSHQMVDEFFQCLGPLIKSFE